MYHNGRVRKVNIANNERVIELARPTFKQAEIISFSEVERDANDEFIYYNLILANNSGAPVPITIDDERARDILPKGDDYMGSIIRFVLPGFTLPLFIPQIQPNQSNVNLTTYSFTLSYGSTIPAQTFVIFIPDDLAQPVPSSPVGNFQVDSLYYYIYHFTSFINMCNIALSTAFTTLKTAVGGSFPSDAVAPYFQYQSGVISLIAQQAYYDQTNVVTPIKIYGNYQVFRFYSSLPVFEISTLPNTNGLDILFNIRDQGWNWAVPSKISLQNTVTATALTVDQLYLNTLQEFNALRYWYDVTSLIFESIGNQIRPEWVPQFAGLTNGSSGSNFKNILTDFVPIIGETPGDFSSEYVYNAPSLYRLFNIMTDQPIDRFGVRITWQTSDQKVRPLYLWPGQSCSIKILFIKKNVLINNLNIAK